MQSIFIYLYKTFYSKNASLIILERPPLLTINEICIDKIHDENNNTPFMNKRMSNLFYVLQWALIAAKRRDSGPTWFAE